MCFGGCPGDLTFLIAVQVSWCRAAINGRPAPGHHVSDTAVCLLGQSQRRTPRHILGFPHPDETHQRHDVFECSLQVFGLERYSTFPNGNSAHAGQRRSREVRVPHWVAHSDMSPADARRDAKLLPVDIPLRYQTVSTPRIPASCLNQPHNLFPRPCMLLFFTFS